MIWNRAGYLAPIRFVSKPACRWWPSAAIISQFKQVSDCRICRELPNDGRNLVVAARPHDSIRFWLPKVQVEAAEITARYPDFCPTEMYWAAGAEHHISICQIERNTYNFLDKTLEANWSFVLKPGKINSQYTAIIVQKNFIKKKKKKNVSNIQRPSVQCDVKKITRK